MICDLDICVEINPFLPKLLLVFKIWKHFIFWCALKTPPALHSPVSTPNAGLRIAGSVVFWRGTFLPNLISSHLGRVIPPFKAPLSSLSCRKQNNLFLIWPFKNLPDLFKENTLLKLTEFTFTLSYIPASLGVLSPFAFHPLTRLTWSFYIVREAPFKLFCHFCFLLFSFFHFYLKSFFLSTLKLNHVHHKNYWQTKDKPYSSVWILLVYKDIDWNIYSMRTLSQSKNNMYQECRHL